MERLANQETLDRLNTQFFHVLRLLAGRQQSPVCRLDFLAVTHQHGSFERVLQLANVPRPRILQKSLQRRRLKAAYRTVIPQSVTREEVRGQFGNIVTSFAKSRET